MADWFDMQEDGPPVEDLRVWAAFTNPETVRLVTFDMASDEWVGVFGGARYVREGVVAWKVMREPPMPVRTVEWREGE